jgi:predicted N-acetyltransferase YhbS
MAITVRNATPDDAPRVSFLARVAKAHWGYPDHWLDVWSDELTITGAYLTEHRGYVAVRGNEIVGVCVLADRREHWTLEHVWVQPELHRQGVGRTLVRHAVTVAQALRPGRVEVTADPHAAPFYMSLGARRVGVVAAPMPGAPDRTLPVLELGTGVP